MKQWYDTERPHWSLELKSPLRFVFEKKYDSC